MAETEPETALTVSPDLAARVACVAAGLLEPEVALHAPPAATLLLRDAEGVTIGRWEASAPLTSGSVDGRLTALGVPTETTYPALRRSPADVGRTPGAVAVVGVAPPPDEVLAALAAPALLLAAAGGVRVDDAAHHRAVRSWQQAAARHGATLVLTPLWPDAPSDAVEQVARHYGATRVVAGAASAPAGSAGLVVLFTGLSGSGKSTVAHRLVSLLTADRQRTVTLLDGDVVRTHLSRGLGFSREDRDTNVLRIGWVAAEIAKHGGIAVAAPIAPYDATRREVRRMAEAACGPEGFVLVHIATPLAECERRDRKGLYAKARAGELPTFTGISDPYEEPTDADLRIDTTDTDADTAATRVLSVLAATGRV